METLRQDVTYAVRSLRRAPGYTATVVATLAIGIGALTAAFAVVNSVLLEPLPFAHPERIVQIWSARASRSHLPTSAANFVDLRTQSRAFESIAAEDFDWYNLTGDGASPERLFGALVSADFFHTLGTMPIAGRAISADEERDDARVVVLGHALWRQRFGGDRNVVGRGIAMNGDTYRVIGVMPPGFDFPSAVIGESVAFWVPRRTQANEARGVIRLGVTALLRPGITFAQAQRDADAVAARLAEAYPDQNKGVTIPLVPLREEIVGSSRSLLLAFFAAVALVLLIACANVGNLALARAQTKEREVHLRAALGAGRVRLARQIFTEQLLLALAGALLGVMLAVWLTAALVALAPAGLPRIAEIGVDGVSLAFALVTSVVAAGLFGFAPARHLLRGQLGTRLQASARAITAGQERRRGRSVVVVLEVATAVVLLVGAGLLLRTLERLNAVDPGFDPRGVVAARLTLSEKAYATGELRRQFIDAALEQLRAMPGAASAAAVDKLPFAKSDLRLDISIEGRAPASDGDVANAHVRAASPDYFKAMRMPLLAGRAIARQDRTGAPLVAVVNETLARTYWPGQPLRAVLGRRIGIGHKVDASEWLTIVGVVGDVKFWSPRDESTPEFYMSLAQSTSSRVNFVVRTDAPVSAAAAGMRTALAVVDKNQPVTLSPLASLVSASVAQPRFRGILFAGFAAVALVLALLGVYGVISYGVTQRTREIGVRIALGARAAEIIRLVLAEGMAITGVGLGVGLAASFAVTRLLSGLLFQVTATDAATFVGVGLLLAVAAMLANYLPARRAARVDPMIAMRAE